MPLEISRFCAGTGLQWHGVAGEDWMIIERSHTLADASAWHVFTRIKTPLRRHHWRVAHPALPEGFRFVPAGTFVMGSPEDEPGRQDREIQRDVTLDAFAMQAVPVTFAQWTEVRNWALDNHYPDLPAGQRGSHGNDRNTDQDPVTMISWYDAVKWLNARSEMEGKAPAYTVNGEVYRAEMEVPQWDRQANGYRLPTEAEWEYAARAGTLTATYAPIGDAAWYRENSVIDGNVQTHPVGQKQANRWGFHDLLGNTYEWCWDWFGSYPAGPQFNPDGLESATNRVLRGGNYQLVADEVRAAIRHAWRPEQSSFTFGFRPAISLPPSEHLRRELQFAETLDFGSIWDGGGSFRELLIENTGDQPVRVEGLSLPAGVTGTFTGVLAPGEQQKVILSYQQSGSDPLAESITVVSDANAGAEQVTLTSANLGVSPDPSGFVTLAGGTYFRGSPPDELGRSPNETRHEVTVASFAIQRTPVTWAQWNAVRDWAIENGYDIGLGQKGSHGDERNTENDPVTHITWHDAVKWLNAKSQMENLSLIYWQNMATPYRRGIVEAPVLKLDFNGYRLPTEAEWEYAARAGTETAFYTGPITAAHTADPALSLAAWYASNSVQHSRPVGGRQPNAWGLYDMLGNVHEWCGDWYQAAYQNDGPNNPRGPVSGTRRILRGGSWANQAHYLRAAQRQDFVPGTSAGTLGFRPVIQTLPEP